MMVLIAWFLVTILSVCLGFAPIRFGLSRRIVPYLNCEAKPSMSTLSINKKLETLKDLLDDMIIKFSIETVCRYLTEKSEDGSRKWLLQFQSLHDVNRVGTERFLEAMSEGKNAADRPESMPTSIPSDKDQQLRNIDDADHTRITVLVLRAMDVIRKEIIADSVQIKDEHKECIRIATIWLQEGEMVAHRSRRSVAPIVDLHEILAAESERVAGMDSRYEATKEILASADLSLVTSKDSILSAEPSATGESSAASSSGINTGNGWRQDPSIASTLNRATNFGAVNALVTSFVIDLLRDRLVTDNELDALHFFDGFMESLVASAADVDMELELELEDSDGAEDATGGPSSDLDTSFQFLGGPATISGSEPSSFDDDSFWMNIPQPGTPADVVEKLFLRALLSAAKVDWSQSVRSAKDLGEIGEIMRREGRGIQGTGNAAVDVHRLADMLITGRNDAADAICTVLGDGPSGLGHRIALLMKRCLQAPELRGAMEGKLPPSLADGESARPKSAEKDSFESALGDILSGGVFRDDDGDDKRQRSDDEEQQRRALVRQQDAEDFLHMIQKREPPRVGPDITSTAVNLNPSASASSPPPGMEMSIRSVTGSPSLIIGTTDSIDGRYASDVVDRLNRRWNETKADGDPYGNDADDSDFEGASVRSSPEDDMTDPNGDLDSLHDGPVGWTVSDADVPGVDDESSGAKPDSSGAGQKSSTAVIDGGSRMPPSLRGPDGPVEVENREPVDYDEIPHGHLSDFDKDCPGCHLRIVGTKNDDLEGRFVCIEGRYKDGAVMLRWIEYEEGTGLFRGNEGVSVIGSSEREKGTGEWEGSFGDVFMM